MSSTTKKKKKKQKGKDTYKISAYFTEKELNLVSVVATELLNVGLTKFLKGAAIEMARATLELAKAQEAAKAEGATNDSNEARSEEVTTTVNTSTSDERTSAST